MANTRRGDLGPLDAETDLELESTGGSGQTGGDRRWEQVAKRVEGQPEAEGKTGPGTQATSGQSLGSVNNAKRDGEDR